MTELYKRLVLASNAINYLATDQRPDEYQAAFERAKKRLTAKAMSLQNN